MYNLLAVLNGLDNDLGDGGIVAILAIILVFAILAIIIGINYLVSYLIELKEKKANDEVVSEVDETPVVAPNPAVAKTVELDSEDAVVAMLVASIDYRNEIKKDIKVISVKEIK